MGSYLIVSFLLYFATSHCINGDENIERRCRVDDSTCFPKQLEWAKLADDLKGKLVWPDRSMNYTHYNFQYNLMRFTYPLVHVVVHSAEDVRAAIMFAHDNNLRVTVKSTGNDILGRSSAHSSFSINMMDMKEMTVTASTSRSVNGEVKVETGVIWGEIYEEVDKYNRTVVGPFGNVVSPGGSTMGGGYGLLTASFGLAADNVLEMQVVLADGRISTCTEHQTKHVYPDGTEHIEENGKLFWAMRGGGGGTFGVVVYYVFKLHPALESLVMVTMTTDFYHNTHNYDVATTFLEKYYSWSLRAPRHWASFLLFDNYPLKGVTNGVSWNKTGGIRLFLVKLGPWDENIDSELQEFFDLRKELPDYISTQVGMTNLTSFWDFAGSIQEPSKLRVYTVGSLIPPESHNTRFTQFFKDEFMNDESFPVRCTFIRLGGKLKEFLVNSSSVNPAWRSAQSYVDCESSSLHWGEGNKVFEDQDRLKDQFAELGKRLREFGNGEYFNEGDPSNPNWKVDIWGEHYVDLLWVKVRYDPDNFFSCHHCVGSDYDTFTFTNTSAATRASFTTMVLMMLVNLFK